MLVKGTPSSLMQTNLLGITGSAQFLGQRLPTLGLRVSLSHLIQVDWRLITNSVVDPSLNNAIFHYEGADDNEPTTAALTSVSPLIEANLVPYLNPGAPGGTAPADVGLNLDIGLVNGVWSLNGSSFFPPSTPVLLQILSGKSAAQDLLPSGNVYTLPKNKVIEISIPDMRGIESTHPFHLVCFVTLLLLSSFLTN